MKKLLVIVFILFCTVTKAQVVAVGTIPNLDAFYKMDTLELKFDSMMPANDPAFPMAFSTNRSRIMLNEKTNDQPVKAPLEKMPALCECYTDKDTLTIKTGIGFFGGFGFEIKVGAKGFRSAYFEYIDDVRPYKYSLADTATYSAISVSTQQQTLTLLNPPAFNPGQQVTGYFTFTTQPFYVKQNALETNKHQVLGHLYFTCKPRAKTEFDK